MSSKKSVKISCATCGQVAGIFICRGCEKNFCLKHTNEHRGNLEKQMKQLLVQHQQIHVNQMDQSKLFKQIQQWEEKTIEKIHQIADDKRRNLMKNYDKFKDNFQQLTLELEKARDEGEFFEKNLNEWKKKLDQLEDLVSQQKTNTSIEQINHDDLEQSFYEDYSSSKEKDEYSVGKHLLRFKIDEYQANTSIFLGIRAKNLSENRSFYGWTGDDLVYLAGIPHEKYQNYRINIQSNDILILIIDCQEKKISLTNERTRQTHQLTIDLVKCPFPWQINVKFFLRSK